jgi:hypothetical protein
MNISGDIVNDAHLMSGVINNNNFKKLTWTYHKKFDNVISVCHDDSSKIVSIKYSSHEGPERMYFSVKENVTFLKVNYYLKNDILMGTMYITAHCGFESWVQYQFDNEFKFEFYE